MKITDKHVLFWGGSIFSNFTKVPGGIQYKDMKFPTSEHLFMYFKAIHFEDFKTAEDILKAKTPGDAKKLGRKVAGYSDEAWDHVRTSYMFTAVMLKAESWPDFKTQILSEKFKDRGFVEASPYDRIWGIGLGEDDPTADAEVNWEGKNLLGKVLDKVREELEKA